MQSRFLDPVGLARVGNMELVAKQVVEGFLTGRHRSPYHGFSVEFLDHRAYTPGDDLRSIDWKIVARSNKYYVKLFEDETNLRAYILLDCSRSMAFKSGEMDKLNYGAHLAAALTYLLIRQNDSVGLITFDTQVRDFIPPKAHPSQFRRILDSLDGIQPGGETDVGVVLHDVAQRIKRRCLVIVISDMLDSRMISNPKRMRQKYLERMQRFIQNVKTNCLERRISYELANTAQPYDKFLGAYLDKRSRVM
jgi:uncharacterized protein (DUF58 family)